MLRKVTLMLAAAAAASVLAAAPGAAQDTLKIGASAPKTGPLAGGAAVTHWPQFSACPGQQQEQQQQQAHWPQQQPPTSMSPSSA